MKYLTLLARDVTFMDKAQEFFDLLLSRSKTSNVKKYLNKTFKNYIIEEYKNVRKKTIANSNDPEWMKKKIANKEDVYILEDFTALEKNTFLHYVDFLNALPPNKVININPKDLPNAVKEWDKTFQNKEANNLSNEDGVEVIKEYSKGYKWLKVFGKKSLKREGDIMNHCVGGEGYYKEVSNNKCAIYSLRDKSNKPHVTIEIDLIRQNDIVQIQGNSNTIPKQKYCPYIADFIFGDFIKTKVQSKEDIEELGFGVQDKKLYSMYNLPDGYTIRDLEIEDVKDVKITIPKNLTVVNTLRLFEVEITNTEFDGLTANTLELEDCISNRIKIKENCKINNLDIRNTKFSLSDNMTIDGDVELSSRESPFSLPNNLTVIGDLDVDDNITEIPEGLTVKGTAYFYDASGLPETCNINVLKIEKGSDFNIYEEDEGKINFLFIEGRKISLENWFFEMEDDRRNRMFEDFDSEMNKKSVDLQEVIDTISANYEVDFAEELEENIDNINFDNVNYDELTIANLDFISKLPKSGRIGILYLEDTGIKEIPNDLDIDELYIHDHENINFPNHLVLKVLDISDSNVRKLPPNLECDLLELKNVEIDELPKTIICKKIKLYKFDDIVVPDELKDVVEYQ